MANLQVKDATSATVYLSETGAGSDGDPFVPNVAAKTNARRNAGVLHRSAVTSADKLATPGTISATGVTVTSSSLVSATAYGVAVVARNVYGNTLQCTSISATPGGAFNALRVTIPQTSGATDYDLFLTSGTTTSMLMVGSITEADRAAGGYKFTTAFTKASGGAASAGQVDIGVIGTGVAVNSASFATSTAYAWSGITPIVCTGYSRAHVYVQVTLTDMRTFPSLVLTPMFQNQIDSNYYIGSPVTVALTGVAGASLRQDFVLDVDGALNFQILVDSITGQGASVNLWVELM